MWAQQVVNGLTSGVVYALLGMGFSLVWSTTRSINFAYGVTFTFGAYLFYVVIQALDFGDQSVLLALVLSFGAVALAGALAGYLLELAIFRPLRGNVFAPFFAALGVAIAAETIFVLIFGAGMTVFAVSGTRDFYRLGPVTITTTQIIVIGASVAIMVGLHLFIQRTRSGRAMRATAFDRRASRLMGINVNNVAAAVFVVSTIIGVWAGAFVSLFYGVLQPYMGSSVLVKGLAAAILGGFGSIPGAIVGGLLIGLLEAGAAGLTTTGNWQDVVAYGVLILVIILRPQGIFGERGLQTR